MDRTGQTTSGGRGDHGLIKHDADLACTTINEVDQTDNIVPTSCCDEDDSARSSLSHQWSGSVPHSEFNWQYVSPARVTPDRHKCWADAHALSFKWTTKWHKPLSQITSTVGSVPVYKNRPTSSQSTIDNLCSRISTKIGSNHTCYRPISGNLFSCTGVLLDLAICTIGMVRVSVSVRVRFRVRDRFRVGGMVRNHVTPVHTVKCYNPTSSAAAVLWHSSLQAINGLFT